MMHAEDTQLLNMIGLIRMWSSGSRGCKLNAARRRQQHITVGSRLALREGN